MGTEKNDFEMNIDCIWCGLGMELLKFGSYDFKIDMEYRWRELRVNTLKFGNLKEGGCRPHFLQPRATAKFWAWGRRGGGQARTTQARRAPLPSHARPARRVSPHVSYNVYCATHRHIA